MRCFDISIAFPSVELIRTGETAAAQVLVQTVSRSGVKPAGEKPVLVFVPDETGMRLTQVWGAAKIGQELLSGNRS